MKSHNSREPYVERVMDCSACHMTLKDSERLDNSWAALTSYKNDYGHFVVVPPLEFERAAQIILADGFSMEFVNVLRLAKANDCALLRMDCDGVVYEDLPQFDW